ncbi:sensor histidine kinase [Saccharopolyspora sp. NPDC050389]|uniref:sensor histidine kinase n=1 Tax=Saccharopolyspora sp. NPDC050389 TaxID=3155516 RepID=UPI0033E7ECB6
MNGHIDKNTSEPAVPRRLLLPAARRPWLGDVPPCLYAGGVAIPRSIGVAADLAAAAALTAIMLVAAAISTDLPARPVDTVVVVGVIVIGAWVAAARRWPRTALVGACASFFIVLAIGVPAFSPALALGYELFVVALAGRFAWGVSVIGLIGVSGLSFRLLGAEAEPFTRVAIDTLFDVTLLSVLVLLGETLHSRRAIRADAGLRLRIAEQEHDRRMADERLHIARDLHDVLAHTMTVVGIQANVAADCLADEPGRAREAVDRVRAAGEDAMADLRSTIAVLRSRPQSEGSTRPAPNLEQLPELVDTARIAGMPATLEVRGETAMLRPSVALTVYRLVQESVTNALRHSGGSALAVTVDCGSEEVVVTVRDNGQRASRPNRSPGSGLRGMTERTSALGGTLECGRADDGMPGWQVRARLPAGGAS